MSIFKLGVKIILLSLLLNFAGSCHAGSSGSLSKRIYAESRLPTYLNTQEAIFVFERFNVNEEIELELAFRENQTQQVPAAPLKVVLSGANARHEETIDISSWPWPAPSSCTSCYESIPHVFSLS